MCERTIGFCALALWNLQFVVQLYRCDAKEVVVSFDAAFHVGFQLVCCRYPARFQRASECARESTCKPRYDVIDGCG